MKTKKTAKKKIIGYNKNNQTKREKMIANAVVGVAVVGTAGVAGLTGYWIGRAALAGIRIGLAALRA